MPVNRLFSGRTPKESESITDCQDYFEINEATGCFAIADGASQSFYPAIWAKLLVQHFCKNPEISASNWRTWLEPIQAQWLNEVRSRVETAKSLGKPTWIEGYNGLNAQRSSTSTFIGLRFSEDKIKACVVGDSCLFVLRNTNLQSYPLIHSEDFNDRPEYFASYPKDNHFKPRFFDIDFEQLDDAYVILATDALSEYVLRCFEQGENIFSSLVEISSQKQFEDFVASARHETVRMKNDDVTLLILSYNPSSLHNTSQAPRSPVEVASSSSIVLSDQCHSETPQIADPTSNVNLVKSLFRTIIDFIKHPSFPTTTKKTTQSLSNSKRNSSKTITQFQQQRALLFFLLFLSVAWNIKQHFERSHLISSEAANPGNQVNTPTETPEPPTKSPEAKPETPPQPKISEFQLKVGTFIYKDENLTKTLVKTSSSNIKVQMTEGTSKSNKIEVNLYAHNSTSKSQNCQGENITLKENIRSSADGNSQINLIGKLNEPVQFKNLDPKAQDWCKFRFVGYISK